MLLVNGSYQLPLICAFHLCRERQVLSAHQWFWHLSHGGNLLSLSAFQVLLVGKLFYMKNLKFLFMARIENIELLTSVLVYVNIDASCSPYYSRI